MLRQVKSLQKREKAVNYRAVSRFGLTETVWSICKIGSFSDFLGVHSHSGARCIWPGGDFHADGLR